MLLFAFTVKLTKSAFVVLAVKENKPIDAAISVKEKMIFFILVFCLINLNILECKIHPFGLIIVK